MFKHEELIKELAKAKYQIIFNDVIVKKNSCFFRIRLNPQKGKINFSRLFGKKWLNFRGDYRIFYPEFNRFAMIKNQLDRYDKEVLAIIKNLKNQAKYSSKKPQEMASSKVAVSPPLC